MGTYRLEVASTGRAGCQNKKCKDEKVKIGKGELRLGTWVDTEKFQSFFWRHWGCVTPKIIANLNEAVEEASGDSKDLDALDGFEDLPPGYQEKVREALEQGHVDDEDWKGDPEMNRPGMKGFRKRVPKKKADEEEAETASEKEEKTPKSKKRVHAQTDKDKPEEKATAPKAKRAKKGGRAKQESDTDDDQQQESNEEEVQPKPTVTRRGRVSKAAAEEKAPQVSEKPAPKRQRKSMGEDSDEAEPVEEKPKRGRRKKST